MNNMLLFSSRRRALVAVVQLLVLSLLLRGIQGFLPSASLPSNSRASIIGQNNLHELHATNLKTKIQSVLTRSPLNDTSSLLSTGVVENGNPELVFFEDDDETLAEREQMKNTMLFLCFGVALLSALDRVAMSVAIVPMSADFGYTDTMKGSISSLLSVGYGLGIVPAGIVVATASPRIVMACGIAAWSLATIATPYAAAIPATMAPLLLARASVGAAESVVLPTLQTLLSSWTSPEQKSRSLATVFTGFHAGTVAAYLISPLLIEYFGGWECLFLIYGAIGLLWLIPWLSFSKDQPESSQQYKISAVRMTAEAAVAREETDLMGEMTKSLETLKAAPWKEFATSKGAWAMLLAHAANNWGLYNTLSWSPTFYSEHYGLSVRDSALYSVLPSIAGAFGGLLAGTLSDALLAKVNDEEDEEKRIQGITNLRKAFQGAALGIPAIALFTLSSHIPDQPWVAQSLLMATTGLQAFNAAGYLSANQEKAGQKWAGLLYSITSLPAVMVGTVGVYLTGQILDYTNQDWSTVFALNSAVFLLGATSFVALYDSKREFD